MKNSLPQRLRSLFRPMAGWAAILGGLHVVWHVLVPASFLVHEGAVAVAVAGGLAFKGVRSLQARRLAMVRKEVG